MLAQLLSAGTYAWGQAPKRPEPPPPQSIPANQWDVQAVEQESEGPLRKLRGNAWVENTRMLVRAERLDWNEETGDIKAEGDVYFHDFTNKREFWCDRLEYNMDNETGKFFQVRGEMVPAIVNRPGVLPSTSPFYFEGEWAERIGDNYVLHRGFITNCKMPRPWWRLKGPRFLIAPGDKAVAYQTTFRLKGVPLFYTPYFYHSLKAEPRKSGFLMPNIGNSSQRGILLGLGYFWALNRSYDVTYRVLDYTSRGFAHHVDLRGNPREGTDFYAIVYGVQDRGKADSGNPPQQFSGLSLYGTGRAELGHGWNIHAEVNYITSFRFRQEWTQSYNEAIGSEIHSTGFLNKSWSTYTFDAVFARLENFQSIEVQTTDPVTGDFGYIHNAVTIRKLPEAEFSSRDRRVWKGLPLWFSMDSSAGLLYRDEPVFNTDGTQLIDRFQTGQFMNRVNLAPHLTGMLHFGAFHLIPSIGVHETYYGEGQEPYQDRFRVTGTNIVRSARDFSLDLVLPSAARVFNKKTVFGDKLKHVIEPRATYRYVTGIGSDFNRFVRFDETDLLSDTNELALSVTNRLYAKRGDSVQEILTWEVMQKRYFDPTFGGALQPGQRNLFESTADLSAYAFVVWAAGRVAGGVETAREPDRTLGHSMAGGLRPAVGADRGQHPVGGLPLETFLHVGGEQRRARAPRAGPRGQPVPDARGVRGRQPARAERGGGCDLRLPPRGASILHHDALLQHRLLRAQPPVPPLQRGRARRNAVPRGLCHRQRGQLRNVAQTGPDVLTRAAPAGQAGMPVPQRCANRIGCSDAGR